jgi:hypothetical protein
MGVVQVFRPVQAFHIGRYTGSTAQRLARPRRPARNGWRLQLAAGRVGWPVSRKHERTGLRSRPEYRVWAEMIQRCHNPRNANFKNYGARGVAVCDEWRASFALFFQDVGARPEGVSAAGRALFSIDRIDNDGSYAPGNVRWATQKIQTNNRRVTGRRSPAAIAARAAGLTEQAIRYRLKCGLTIEQAAAKPRDNRGQKPRKAA